MTPFCRRGRVQVVVLVGTAGIVRVSVCLLVPVCVPHVPPSFTAIVGGHGAAVRPNLRDTRVLVLEVVVPWGKRCQLTLMSHWHCRRARQSLG